MGAATRQRKSAPRRRFRGAQARKAARRRTTRSRAKFLAAAEARARLWRLARERMRAGRRRGKRSAPARFLPSRSQIAARPLPLVLSSCDGAPEGSSTRRPHRSPCSPRPRLEACPGQPPLPRLEPAAPPGSCRRSPHPADSLIPKRRSAAPRSGPSPAPLLHVLCFECIPCFSPLI